MSDTRQPESFVRGPAYTPSFFERQRVRALIADTHALLAEKRETNDHDHDHDQEMT